MSDKDLRIISDNNVNIIAKHYTSVVYRTILDVRWSSDKQGIMSSSQGIRVLLFPSRDLMVHISN